MKIVIDGPPVAKMRARHTRRGQFTVTYDPQEKKKHEVKAAITAEFSKLLNSENPWLPRETSQIFHAKAYRVKFLFFLPVNSSDSVTQRNKKLWGIQFASSKPDYDNLEKFYLDCANEVLWEDDCMIIYGESSKHYDENPRVEIIVEPVKQMSLMESQEKIICMFSPSELDELWCDMEDFQHLYIPPAETPSMNQDSREWMLASVANALSSFALKYASKLKKIEKLGDVSGEAKKIAKTKNVIERGEFNI